MMSARKIHINGIVQGVGFRPFVYSLAKKYHITGWVRNSSAGVEIVANGKPEEITGFLEDLQNQPPPLSKIDEFFTKEISHEDFLDFSIVPSEIIEGEYIPVSPDVGICEDCLKELFDPSDRRYRYPFINCTNCGPRFTIIKDIPYDRPLTTMAPFTMCAECLAEYEDPLNRRFHAQPVACPECGPRVWFENAGKDEKSFDDKGIQLAREFIRQGKIVAIKGLGGFHLACDATNAEAVAILRSRKKRSDKSFALMVRDAKTAKKYGCISKAEQILLESRSSPIVILDRNEVSDLPQAIAPGVNTLGLMLPYTPLHYLLMEDSDNFPEILVMTSANLSDEPIVFTNKSAKIELAGITDAFLLNDREINTRLDDSVVSELKGKVYFLRRSRGYAPSPIKIKTKMGQILATGAELKNTFCLTKDSYAFLSHHIGDLENLETLQSFEQAIPYYEHIFKVKPEVIACDLHPDYLSTLYAIDRSCTDNLNLIPVQHHHAHLASALADNQWDSSESVIGICLDGTGYGADGNIWGGEILYGGYAQYSRVLHLENMPLPGGDSAIYHPGRIAAAYLWKNQIEWASDIPAVNSLDEIERVILNTQLEKDINCPKTSSMGRLFDAVAGLIGLRNSTNYEAQAAIELENSIDHSIYSAYEFEISEQNITFSKLLSDIIKDYRKGRPVGVISAKFHNAIRKMILKTAQIVTTETGCKIVALSGGVWQNSYLIKNAIKDLERNNYQVLIHSNVPANDGGIALGQALVANNVVKG